MGQGESRDAGPQIAPVSGQRREIRPIRNSSSEDSSRQRNRGGTSLYPEVSPYESRSTQNSNARSTRTRKSTRGDDADPILPVISHWNAQPLFQLRYLAFKRSEKEAASIGADINMFNGRTRTFLKYKFDDMRLGLRGGLVPQEIYGSLGVIGTQSNRLIMSVGYNFARQEPLVGFKVKSNDLLRARVGGRSGASSPDSPAGLDYKLKLNLSPTSKVRAIGSLDLPQGGIIVGEGKDPIHLAVNSVGFKQTITRDFLVNGIRDFAGLIRDRFVRKVRETQGDPNLRGSSGRSDPMRRMPPSRERERSDAFPGYPNVGGKSNRYDSRRL